MKRRSGLLLLVIGLGLGLVASSVLLLSMAAANGPVICSVPGVHGTIQAAINDLSCDLIDVGVGTFQENVTISRTVTIQGQGISSTTVDGTGAGSVFIVLTDVAAMLGDMTIANGAAEHAGGIDNSGVLTLTKSWVTGNEAFSGEGSGGINNSGRLTLFDVSVTGNESYEGAGINNHGLARLTHSTVSGNIATVQGGAVFNRGDMTIISSTVNNNWAGHIGGGIVSGGGLTVTDSTVSDNVVGNQKPWFGGGGFYFYGGARVQLTNSTVSSNSAVTGGGILAFVNDAITMTNVTLFGNTAVTQAGGIHVTVISTTVNVANSIIAGNSGGDCSGAAITSSGHNIGGDDTCSLAGPGDMNETDPLLGPLGNHGGPTYTHLPLPGSPAIDSGSNSLCPTTDQRGYARPVDGDEDGPAVCDIGSAEIRHWTKVFLPQLVK